MCVTKREGGDCPTDQDSTTCGSYFSTNDEDTTFLVKITRKAGAPATCTPFTVTVDHY